MAYILFAGVTRRIFYHRYVNYLASEYKEIELEKAGEEGQEISEEEAVALAYKHAKEHIKFNIKYRWF